MPIPYPNHAYRVRYHETGMAKHRAKLTRSPFKALHSWMREIGDVLVGAFQQVASA